MCRAFDRIQHAIREGQEAARKELFEALVLTTDEQLANCDEWYHLGICKSDPYNRDWKPPGGVVFYGFVGRVFVRILKLKRRTLQLTADFGSEDPYPDVDIAKTAMDRAESFYKDRRGFEVARTKDGSVTISW
jgi:hypothetical protein